jgi:hypothetical protein
VVLGRHRSDKKELQCWCEVPGRIEKGDFPEKCNIKDFKPNNNAVITGARFKPDLPPEELGALQEIRVLIKGDFIRDQKDKAVDANHLPPWFNTGNYRTGDGVAGGTFESWFSLTN